MPIHSGTDKDGSFYQWGSTGKKYHFNPNDKKSRQNALRKAKAQQTAIYSSGWKGDNNMADKMKLIKVKTGDAKPSMRVKAAGNVFVEIYKDNNGFFYKIDVPGQTGYESKERFQDQSKALSSGTAHAKRFIASIKSKVGDEQFSKIGNQILSKLEDVIHILREREAVVTNHIGEDRKKAEIIVLSIENRLNEVYTALRNWKKQVR